jgi:uncharacterized protein YbbC (DUF1343 family)
VHHGIRLLLVGATGALLSSAAPARFLPVANRGPASRGTAGARQRDAVLPGIDVLLRDSARLVEGRRLGLITNRSGVDARGVSTIERLAHLPGARLVALFAPEHGAGEGAAPGVPISDTVDAATGLPIYSLYGARRAPTAAQLASLDVLLLDLQDVGARTYTYVSTMVLALQAAASAHRRLVVLDRPNPLGCAVQGPLLDTTYASFIGMLPVPLRHGMTMGELARFANADLRLGADLAVVPVRGWRRCQWFDETGLPWIAPSPNLPDLESVAWYPGTVLFEATNLSVGRGTAAPFRQIGAPWLDAGGVARRMARRYHIALDPVRFTPHAPGDGKFDGVEVRGVRFRRFDRARGDPIRAALLLLKTVRELQPARVRVDSLGLARRLGVWPSDTVTWPGDRRRFLAERRTALIY